MKFSGLPFLTPPDTYVQLCHKYTRSNAVIGPLSKHFTPKKPEKKGFFSFEARKYPISVSPQKKKMGITLFDGPPFTRVFTSHP